MTEGGISEKMVEKRYGYDVVEDEDDMMVKSQKVAVAFRVVICLMAFWNAIHFFEWHFVNAAVAEDASETYKARFFVSGMLMRAGMVCGKNWKGNAKVGIDLIATPELRDLARAYPETTKKWLEAGAENFNNGVMQDGLPAACKFADDMRRKAQSIR